MILVDDVTLTFPDGAARVTAVDHASLSVGRGTVVGITGPSGSGKSSLLAVVSTLIRADSGSIVIDDIDVSRLSLKESAQLRRNKLGIIFQQSNLLPSLTALDQLLVMEQLRGGRVGRAARDAGRTRALALLDAVGLADHPDKLPSALSGGERQRVNIARALMNRPTVLVIDEPTSSLDQAGGMRIIDLILELTTAQNTATLLVTHDESHLDRFATHYVMVDGNVKEASPAPAVTMASG